MRLNAKHLQRIRDRDSPIKSIEEDHSTRQYPEFVNFDEGEEVQMFKPIYQEYLGANTIVRWQFCHPQPRGLSPMKFPPLKKKPFPTGNKPPLPNPAPKAPLNSSPVPVQETQTEQPPKDELRGFKTRVFEPELNNQEDEPEDIELLAGDPPEAEADPGVEAEAEDMFELLNQEGNPTGVEVPRTIPGENVEIDGKVKTRFQHPVTEQWLSAGRGPTPDELVLNDLVHPGTYGRPPKDNPPAKSAPKKVALSETEDPKFKNATPGNLQKVREAREVLKKSREEREYVHTAEGDSNYDSPEDLIDDCLGDCDNHFKAE